MFKKRLMIFALCFAIVLSASFAFAASTTTLGAVQSDAVYCGNNVIEPSPTQQSVISCSVNPDATATSGSALSKDTKTYQDICMPDQVYDKAYDSGGGRGILLGHMTVSGLLKEWVLFTKDSLPQAITVYCPNGCEDGKCKSGDNGEPSLFYLSDSYYQSQDSVKDFDGAGTPPCIPANCNEGTMLEIKDVHGNTIKDINCIQITALKRDSVTGAVKSRGKYQNLCLKPLSTVKAEKCLEYKYGQWGGWAKCVAADPCNSQKSGYKFVGCATKTKTTRPWGIFGKKKTTKQYRAICAKNTCTSLIAVAVSAVGQIQSPTYTTTEVYKGAKISKSSAGLVALAFQNSDGSYLDGSIDIKYTKSGTNYIITDNVLVAKLAPVKAESITMSEADFKQKYIITADMIAAFDAKIAKQFENDCDKTACKESPADTFAKCNIAIKSDNRVFVSSLCNRAQVAAAAPTAAPNVPAAPGEAIPSLELGVTSASEQPQPAPIV